MRQGLSLILLLCIAASSHSQNSIFSDATIYIKAGATYSTINDLKTTILSEPYFSNDSFSMNTKPQPGFVIGIGGEFPIGLIPCSLSTELVYLQAGSELDFENIPRQWGYKMGFNYQYVYLPILFKAYLFVEHDGNGVYSELKGPYIGFGIQPGFNVSSSNITYKSHGQGLDPAFGTDLEQQQQLRTVLKGKNDFGAIFQLGWQISNWNLGIHARYYLGLSDAVETQTNAYHFIENKNNHRFFEFGITWNFIPYSGN